MKEIVAGRVKEVMGAYQTGRVDMYMVTPEALAVREGFNAAREADPDYPQAVRELADSIKANGFQRHKPICVAAASDGKLYISDGHTRYAALMLAIQEGAQIEAVPVVNEVKGTSDEDRIAGLVLNNTGRRLVPLGEAMVCKELMGRGVDEKEIARRLFGGNVQKVQNLLTLIAAPAPVRNMVKEGKVSATLAVKTLKSDGAEAVATLQAAGEIAKAKGSKKVMAKHMAAPKPRKGPMVIPDVDQIRQRMSDQHAKAISPAAVEIVRNAILAILTEV